MAIYIYIQFSDTDTHVNVFSVPDSYDNLPRAHASTGARPAAYDGNGAVFVVSDAIGTCRRGEVRRSWDVEWTYEN